MDNVLAKDLMTEAELSQYETLEKLYNSLYVASPNLEDSILGQANELARVINNQMKAMREKVLLRGDGKLVFDGENDRYFTDESFGELFTGWAFVQDEDFIPDDGKAEHICYFKDGKLSTSGIPRNVSKYILEDAWYCIITHGLNNVIFNLGCENPVAILLHTDNESFKIDNAIWQVSNFLTYHNNIEPIGYRNEIIPMVSKDGRGYY